MKASKITATVVFDYTELLTKIKGEIRDYGDGEITVSARVRFDGETWGADIDLDTDTDSVVSKYWFRGPVNNARRVTLEDVQATLDAPHLDGLARALSAMVAMVIPSK